MATEKKYLGNEALEALVGHIKSEDAKVLDAAKEYAKEYADGLADNYDAAGTAQTKVDELANGQVAANTAAIGTMDNLETTDKESLVKAINEVRNSVSAGGTAAAVTMTKTTPEDGGLAAVYTIKQGENTVGTIDIPKDMVVESGEVVVNPDGQPAGTYIKLVLANATNDIIYVNVGTLVDIYKAKEAATQVQIAIDSATREISATIVAGSITATELADNAVTTVKIADGNVTKAKLSSEVQGLLDKADVAEQNAKDYADGLDSAMDERVKAVEDAVGGTGSVATAIETAKTEAIGAANSYTDTAVAGAKTYTDEAVGAFVEITSAEVDALFA